jgi:hypothetical protein
MLQDDNKLFDILAKWNLSQILPHLKWLTYSELI